MTEIDIIRQEAEAVLNKSLTAGNFEQRLRGVQECRKFIRTTVPHLCDALKVAVLTLQSQGDHISVAECCRSARIVLARIDKILKGKDG